jgi:hypothetical protein
VIKRNLRYLVLALPLIALTATVQKASAQCTDNCVVTGGDPEPMSSFKLFLIVLANVVLP